MVEFGPVSMAKATFETPKKPARLYLRRIDAHFDSRRDRVLGPWCFAGEEERFPDWEEMTFNDAFSSNEAQEQAAEACASLIRYKIGQEAEHLNEFHHRAYGLGYWWALIAPWLTYLIPMLWRRWVLALDQIKRHGDKDLALTVFANAEDVDWDFSGFFQFFHDGVRSDVFDYWIYSLVFKNKAPENWTLGQKSVDLPERLDKDQVLQPPAKSSRTVGFIRSVFGHLPVIDLPGMTRLASLAFSFYVAFIIPKRKRGPNFIGKTEPAPPTSFPKEFLDFVDFVMAKTRPRFLGEDFQAYELKAKRHAYRAGRLFVTSPSHHNIPCAFRIAHAIEAGERVVRMQAGSNYGTTQFDHLLELTEYLYEGVLTWGWTQQNDSPGRFIPIPSPALSRIADRHAEANDKIIMVGTLLMMRLLGIGAAPQPSYVPIYRKEKARFIETLTPDERKSFVYRPYGRSKGEIDEASYLKRHFPALEIYEGPLDQALLRCRLLVLDHPGSTLSFAMAANVPTICFWPSKHWCFSSQATPYFEALKKAGILFETGPDAAAKIKEIGEDVQGWWQEEGVQAARQNWANQYARTDAIWWRRWVVALWRL
jgi:putative transferase (TIGR04331 family)